MDPGRSGRTMASAAAAVQPLPGRLQVRSLATTYRRQRPDLPRILLHRRAATLYSRVGGRGLGDVVREAAYQHKLSTRGRSGAPSTLLMRPLPLLRFSVGNQDWGSYHAYFAAVHRSGSFPLRRASSSERCAARSAIRTARWCSARRTSRCRRRGRRWHATCWRRSTSARPACRHA